MDFKEFYHTYYKGRNVSKEIENLKEELKLWETYRELILEGTLRADEFNVSKEYYNTNEYKGGNGLKCSLLGFLEKKTKATGSMGMMKSDNFPLWIEDKTWKWYKREKGSANPTPIEKKEGEGFFKSEILPSLQELLQKQTLQDVCDYITRNKEKFERYIYQGFLVKLIVLNSLHEDCDYRFGLLGIYDYNGIEQNENFCELSKCTDTLKVIAALKKSAKAVEIFSTMCEPINSEEIFLKAQLCIWDIGKPDVFNVLSEPNVIFYGAPGTGKTYAVRKALHSVPEDQKLFVQFHPGFSYEDFIEGIKPTGIDQNGNLMFEIVNGIFKDFCIKAKAEGNRGKEYYFVADEINRANLSAVFGETLSLLERDYRYDEKASPNDRKACLRSTPLSNAISKAIQKESGLEEKLAFYYNKNTREVLFGVPKNVHFIGMMNDVDKSIDTFDLALRRRFTWIRKEFDGTALEEILRNKYSISEEELEAYIASCKKLNTFISGCDVKKDDNSLKLGKSFEFGHAFYKDIDVSSKRISKKAKEALFDKHLAPTLREYCRSFFNETEIDGKIEEAKKVFCNVDSSGE